MRIGDEDVTQETLAQIVKYLEQSDIHCLELRMHPTLGNVTVLFTTKTTPAHVGYCDE